MPGVPARHLMFVGNESVVAVHDYGSVVLGTEFVSPMSGAWKNYFNTTRAYYTM